MKKILYTANTYNHLYLCHLPYIKYLSSKYIVHTATNSEKKVLNTKKSYCVPIERSPFRINNIRAFFALRKIIFKEKYDLIHTNTPMGAVVTRLAALKYRKKYGIKIIYTAHGFHFFKGCPKINYILYYPIEKILSKFTDIIITMNVEDYNFAKKHFKTRIEYIPGIGFNQKKFSKKVSYSEINKIKNKIGISKNDFIISYIAEISKRKRQMYLVKSLKDYNFTNEKILLLGDDSKSKKIKKYINKYKLNNYIKILGFEDNILPYLTISDLVISVSKQEGLPLNIVEAMYLEKPIIVTDCRGNRDLIKNNYNGMVVGLNDKIGLNEAITFLKNNPKKARKLGENNKDLVCEYSINNVLPIMIKIYDDLIEK